jgi:hypothetical protein
MLRYNLGRRWHGCVWSAHVEIHFESSLAWEGFGQLVLGCFLCFLAGIGAVESTHIEFCILSGMGAVWSRQVEIHLMSSLAWIEFGRHKLRYILCPRWQGMDLLNTC